MRSLLLTSTIAACAALALPAGALAADDLTIDTLTGAPAGYSVQPLSNIDYESGGHVRQSIRAVGQVVTAPEDATAIKRIDFDVWGTNHPGVRAELWTWDGAAAGMPLWQGERHVLATEHDPQSWSFPAEPVEPGQQYLLVLSAFDGGSGFANWVGVGDNGPWDDRCPEGEFVLFPGVDRTTFTLPWQLFDGNGDDDLAFRVVFERGETPPPVEEPPAPPAPPADTVAPTTMPDPPVVAEPSLPDPAPVPVVVPSAAPSTATATAVTTTRRCRVPNLRNRTVTAARRTLKQSGCALGHVDGSGRIVIRQSKPGGRTLPYGTRVSVVVRR